MFSYFTFGRYYSYFFFVIVVAAAAATAAAIAVALLFILRTLSLLFHKIFYALQGQEKENIMK